MSLILDGRDDDGGDSGGDGGNDGALRMLVELVVVMMEVVVVMGDNGDGGIDTSDGGCIDRALCLLRPSLFVTCWQDCSAVTHLASTRSARQIYSCAGLGAVLMACLCGAGGPVNKHCQLSLW
jgi:hypothetical protein